MRHRRDSGKGTPKVLRERGGRVHLRSGETHGRDTFLGQPGGHGPCLRVLSRRIRSPVLCLPQTGVTRPQGPTLGTGPHNPSRRPFVPVNSVPYFLPILKGSCLSGGRFSTFPDPRRVSSTQIPSVHSPPLTSSHPEGDCRPHRRQKGSRGLPVGSLVSAPDRGPQDCRCHGPSPTACHPEGVRPPGVPSIRRCGKLPDRWNREQETGNESV